MPRSDKKERVEIAPSLAAQAMFLSDRTCYVCRARGKFVQIHHIDEDPSNNILKNFAVLCQECHTQTMLTGGFVRKLDAEQVILYRDDWVAKVAAQRASNPTRLPDSDSDPSAVTDDIKLATSIAETYREREEYELLAMHYHGLGNDELRDKYFELAVKQGVDDDTLIYFRSAQERLDLIPKEVIDRRVAELEKRKEWLSLGRLYRTLKNYPAAVNATCRGAAVSINKGNLFSAAFCLKEMFEEGGIDELFVEAMDEAARRGDLWWQYRSLQELEWHEEAKQFLIEHREEIETSSDPLFEEELALILGDRKGYIRLKEEEAKSLSARPDSSNAEPSILKKKPSD